MKYLIYIVSFISLNAIGQSSVGYILEDLPNDSILHNDVKFHSNLRPFIRQSQQRLALRKEVDDRSLFSIAPLVDLNSNWIRI
jgi:hypothetical protein